MHLRCDPRSHWGVCSNVKCTLMVHALRERNALITDPIAELNTSLLLPLPLWLILEECPNALCIQYRYHLISIKKRLIHRAALRIALLALIK